MRDTTPQIPAFDQVTLKAIYSWIKEWEAADFSWEGLSGRVYEIDGRGEGAVPCQLFWGGAELHKAPNGKHYTIFHFPSFWVHKDGDRYSIETTEKLNWSTQDLEKKLVEQCDKWKTRSPNEHPIGQFYQPTSSLREPTSVRVKLDTSGFWLPTDFFITKTKGFVPPSFYYICAYGSDDIEVQSFAEGSLFTSKVNIRLSALKDIKKCLFASGIMNNETFLTDDRKIEIKINNSIISWFKFDRINIGTFTLSGAILHGYKCAINGCTVERIDFQEQDFGSVPSLRGLSENVMITLPDAVATGSFDEEFSQLTRAASDRATFEAGGDPVKLKKLKTRYMNCIELGLVFLRSVHSTKSNDYLSSRFHNYELWTREKNPAHGYWDRLVSKGYHLISKYGNSTSRPLVSLAVFVVISSFLYTFLFTHSAGWKVALSLDWICYAPDALSFALGRALPFVTWDMKAIYPPESFENQMRTLPGWSGLLVHMVAALQTLLSTICLFLVGLACKRRFKMSDK